MTGNAIITGITSGSPQMKLRILQPYRNPGEVACFIEGVKRTAAVLGYDISYFRNIVPSMILLKSPTPPSPEPVVTIEIPEEKPVMVEDKPVKKKAKRKVKRAEPDAGTQ